MRREVDEVRVRVRVRSRVGLGLGVGGRVRLRGSALRREVDEVAAREVESGAADVRGGHLGGQLAWAGLRLVLG